MKEQLLESVLNLKQSFENLKDTWNNLDWSRVPIQVSEKYPFHGDLDEMISAIQIWIETIEKS